MCSLTIECVLLLRMCSLTRQTHTWSTCGSSKDPGSRTRAPETYAQQSKEPYVYGKRGRLALAYLRHTRNSPKSPIHTAKEAYSHGKRGLYAWAYLSQLAHYSLELLPVQCSARVRVGLAEMLARQLDEVELQLSLSWAGVRAHHCGGHALVNILKSQCP